MQESITRIVGQQLDMYKSDMDKKEDSNIGINRVTLRNLRC